MSVRRAKKKELDSVCRVVPDITQRAAEKALVRVATRGVVQLFNAVREQQKNIRAKLKEAGSSRKREKVCTSFVWYISYISFIFFGLFVLWSKLLSVTLPDLGLRKVSATR